MTTCIPVDLKTLYKQPNEVRLFGMSFENKMEKTETITSVDSTISNPTGITFVGNTIEGQIVHILCSNGANTKKYKVTVTITTSFNQQLENDGFLEIIEN